ncbi:MAG: phenylalanine--tRNA ligase subunit alpha, partial [Actinobacteria bacterium]|nr:phenylalanine--tRNA ligase subunit alpha [Actinomycetota bacterium]
MADLAALQETALAALRAAGTVGELDEVRVRFTGKRSELVAAQGEMRDLAPEERKVQGQAINAFKGAFEDAYETRRQALVAAELDTRLRDERLDLSLPPRRVPPGRPHLLTQVLDEIVDVFVGLGYRVAEGPEAESATYNFDLMNIPPDHPARQEMDTVYVAVEDGTAVGDGPPREVVLRTHTSPVQARVMTTTAPPIAVVVPGRVFRADAVDATHSPVFHQVEGLLVDEGVTMADLRGTLLTFARAMFGPERDVRLRPSMFPFTEPSAEVDVSCGFCASSRASVGDSDGGPCRVCSGTGWIEILGSGMVDPAVLAACGIDPDRYSGFAFGVGAERVAMLRHGVTDIREFFEGDVRFLA